MDTDPDANYWVRDFSAKNFITTDLSAEYPLTSLGKALWLHS